MKVRSATCPACGGPVEFKTGSSLVTICDFCQTAVARGDKAVADFGKVADVGETNSGLRLGLSGTFNKKHFFISGRVRYSHPAGGIWDEWYLVFPGEKWGWLTEAQGKFYLMFERRVTSKLRLPEFASISLGSSVELGDREFFVREKGTAKATSAEGEIPWAFRPGDDHRFVDLDGAAGAFATLEYGKTTSVYVGKEVTVAELGIDTGGADPESEKLRVAALQLNCPHCAGTLLLRTPDETQRVTCPHCHSLLDARQGKLSYLQTLKAKELNPIVPIGTDGVFFNNQYTVIGIMERFARYEGKTYPWTEYLLHHHELGFRWLVENQRHWSFVEPVSYTGRIGGRQVSYDGNTFRIFDRGVAYVRYVVGEFYWRVKVGEMVQTADYIAPPKMLSIETTKMKSSEERNVSLGTYLRVEEIEAAFGIKNVARPWGVGPMQPGPKLGTTFVLTWGSFVLLVFMIYAINFTRADGWLTIYAMLFVSLPPAAFLFYAHQFERQRWAESDYNPYATDD
ncbi:hypothetical protein Pla52o_38620 [Novipirellula galeiformis]|uniref:DUF4178 domain-containing protein n=1 Tax=Novipirellula galeiformis TaxID=2528004 RepID=A0A5C6CCB9_9BACT|nr:DUF4178 domain-containing protein [Novipirellula galeiformis]TWU21675.1 hypothetical protein Pla52o_38620 [Novipirellula galeiformis]